MSIIPWRHIRYSDHSAEASARTSQRHLGYIGSVSMEARVFEGSEVGEVVNALTPRVRTSMR